MKHSRSDYDRFQDPAGLIPEDEPVFIIRGQDVVGPDAVRAWASLAASAGADQRIVNAALDHASLMNDWHLKHNAKIPDMP
jgi:hypothetical protein